MHGQLLHSTDRIGRTRVLLEGGNRPRLIVGIDRDLDAVSTRRFEALMAGPVQGPLPQRTALIELSDDMERAEADLYPFQANEGDVVYPDWPLLTGLVRSTEEGVTAWQDRKPVAFWRGVLAGRAQTLTQVMRLQRVRLALEAQFSSRIDAKLTGLGEFECYGDPLRDTLGGLGLIGGGVCSCDDARFYLDVEGDGSDRARSPILLARGCPIRVGKPNKTWFDLTLDHLELIPSALEPVELVPLMSDLEASGEAERIHMALKSRLMEISPAKAAAEFALALEQVN